MSDSSAEPPDAIKSMTSAELVTWLDTQDEAAISVSGETVKQNVLFAVVRSYERDENGIWQLYDLDWNALWTEKHIARKSAHWEQEQK